MLSPKQKVEGNTIVRTKNPSWFGTIVFSGLTESAYQIDFIAARSSAGSGTQRIADYQVNGTFANSTPTGDEFSSYLDGWINASVLTWNSVSSISGEITLTGLGVPNSHFTRCA